MTEGINPNIRLKRKAKKTIAQYLNGLERRDRLVLSEVLTIVESTSERHQQLAQDILKNVSSSDSNGTIRIGITGSPGAGKSTLIEQLGLHIANEGQSVAVLAVDPSSIKSEGSILGDKTRMSALSNHPNAYIRPTASATHLGGVSKTTRESIAICEKAGFDVIIIESVGVGQSEVELANLVDLYALVLLPGSGDDVQGIKRGVVELADIILINKADGERITLAKKSQKDYQGSVRLFSHSMNTWTSKVQLLSALENTGVDDAWKLIQEFITLGKENGYFLQRRTEQEEKYLKNQIQRYVEHWVEQQLLNDANTIAKENETSLFEYTQSILTQITKKLKA